MSPNAFKLLTVLAGIAAVGSALLHDLPRMLACWLFVGFYGYLGWMKEEPKDE